MADEMTQLVTYLTFNGNCREAMQFYQSCFGGALHMQTVGDSPLADKLPQRMREYILHAVLKAGNLVLMATDMVDEVELVRGNNMSIMIQCTTTEEIKNHYKNLSAGGKVTHPVEENFWGALFGGLTDRYGYQWLFHCHRNRNTKSSI